MPRDAADFLQRQHSLRGHPFPLTNGLSRNAKKAADGARAPGGLNCPFKGGEGQMLGHEPFLKHSFPILTSYSLLDGLARLADQERMKASLGSALRTARKRLKLTLASVGKSLGVSAQAVGQWERDEDSPAMENLRAYCDLLGISLDAANRGMVVNVGDGSFDGPENEAERVTIPATPNFGPQDIPVLGTAAGSSERDDDEFIVNGKVIDRVRRPVGIANTNNVFALHIIGTSMEPRYEPGELVYCGGRDPVPGDHVVIEMHPRNGSRTGPSYVKKLIARSGGKVRCEQYSPRQIVEFDTSDVARIYRIIPTKELLGF